VEISRQEGRITAVTPADKQVLKLRYAGELPSAVERGNEAVVQYQYQDGRLSGVENRQHVRKFRYDANGLMSEVFIDESQAAALRIDSKGRLAELSSKGQATAIDYQEMATAAVLSEKAGRGLRWKFGPGMNWLGVIHDDKSVILFTRDRENRIFQMAFARLMTQGGEVTFAVEETVGAGNPPPPAGGSRPGR
jgi:YD repeat-containing protein